MASRRQLFQLLEEKQEPFLLDAYLLENGCSRKRMQRLSSSHGFKGRGAAVGFLRSMLTKLVHGKPFGKALGYDGKPTESGRRSSVFRCCSGLGSRGFGGDHQCGCIEMEDSKQLSPVSVLEFRNNRLKEENQSSTSSFDSPTEDDAGSSAYSRCGKQLLFDCASEAEERGRDGHRACLRTESIGAKRILSWQRLDGDDGVLTEVWGSDMSESRNELSRFGPEVAEVGAEIGAAIFEEIVGQTVWEILGSCRA